MSALKYRPEIDGLRTVAVVPVVLFHAGFGFPGGFIGVDVFFVISGFLITSLILKEGEGFSLLGFWERRVRRIVPAAALMVLVCLIVGWHSMFPLDFARLGRSVVAQALLVSNLFFWQDLSYFAKDDARPLLHTWSLAVEEQFYLFLPFVLYALRRAPRRLIVVILSVTALGSLALSVYATRTHPPAAFYLLPSRAWELLLGSLIAALPPLTFEDRRLNELVSAGGLLAIVLATLSYRGGMRFPGEAALLPCLGAAAIIVGTASTPTLVRGILSSAPFVWLGRISYSLYLWHWPLLSFAHYSGRGASSLDRSALVALSVLAAWLSWRFIELPVRNRVILGARRALFGATACAMAGFLVAGFGIVRAHGVPARWSPEVLRYAEGRFDYDFRVEVDLPAARNGQLASLGNRDDRLPVELLVWGDSHAMAILHVVDMACRERGLRCLAATHSATPPLLNFPVTGVFSLRDDAGPFTRAIVDFTRSHHVKRVLLVGIWAAIDDSPTLFRSSLVQTVTELHSAGAQVIILKDVPLPPFDVPLALARAAAAGEDVERLGIGIAAYRARNQDADAIIDGLPKGAALVLDPAPWFCDDAGLCHFERDGRPLYFDSHHLSTYGATRLHPLFERLLANPSSG